MKPMGWRRGRLVAVLLVAGVASLAGAQEPVLIKMGTLAPDGSSWHQIFKSMGEEWRKAPGGGVTLRIYPGGVLGDEPDLVRKMRVGQIHAAALTAVGLADIDTSVSALQIPMMFRTWEEVDAVREQIRPALERKLEDKGFVVLNWGDAGWVMFFAKQPFSTPADLKKMKLFVWAGDNLAIDMWKAAGYQPVPLSSTDILTGLQTGLINAFDTTPLLALSSQWFGLAKHMLDLKWAPLLGATVIHKKTWDKIPSETQKAMRRAAADAGDRLKADIRAANDKAIDAMKEHGLIVLPSSPEIEAAWTREAEGIYPKMRGTLIPADTFDEVKRLRDAHRASAAAGKDAPR